MSLSDNPGKKWLVVKGLTLDFKEVVGASPNPRDPFAIILTTLTCAHKTLLVKIIHIDRDITQLNFDLNEKTLKLLLDEITRAQWERAVVSTARKIDNLAFDRELLMSLADVLSVELSEAMTNPHALPSIVARVEEFRRYITLTREEERECLGLREGQSLFFGTAFMDDEEYVKAYQSLS